MAYSFKYDNESITFVLNELCYNHNLNDWENKFIRSIKEHFESGKNLSKNQLQKLSDLWEKY